jgi:hypothetical protein
MTRVEMIAHADAAAADVLVQWRSVEIDWADVGTVQRELDAHWGADLANLTEEWSYADEGEYRQLVARALYQQHSVSRNA